MGAARPRGQRLGAVAVVPDPHLRPAFRRRRRAPGPPGIQADPTAEPAGAYGASEAFFDSLMESWESAWPKPRVIVLSFPHNPTTACVDLAWMQRIVDFAREHDIVLVHDFAYADISFDGYTPPSILQVPGAKDVAVELYTLTKSFSMAGWRVAFMVGNAEAVGGAHQVEELSRLRHLPAHPDRRHRGHERGRPTTPRWVNEIYLARRDALCDGLNRIGWHLTKPKGTMFVWAPIPEPYREMGSLEFSSFLVSEAEVATLPGRRVRARRRRPRPLRPHRERAAHRPGRAQPAPDARQAGLSTSRRAVAPAAAGRAERQPAARPSRRADASARGSPRGRTTLPPWPPRPAGRPCSSTSTRARWSVTPRMAWASTSGSSRRIMPAAMPAFTWGRASATACSSPWRMSGAKRSSVRANSSRTKRWRLSSSHSIDAADARLDAAYRVGLVGDGLALGAAQVALGVGQDLAEELLLGGEVPVEDPLAHAEAVDDVGDRGRVVPLGGELPGGEVEELLTSPLPPCGQAACHGRRRYRVAIARRSTMEGRFLGVSRSRRRDTVWPWPTGC